MSGVQASDPRRTLARELAHELFVTLRSAQIYEPGNETLRTAVDRLARTLEAIVAMDGRARFEVGGDLIFVNGVRVRSELRSHAVHSALTGTFAELGIGGFEWQTAPEAAALARFVQVVGRFDGGEPVAPAELGRRLGDAGVEGVAVLSPRQERARDPFEDPDARGRAESSYRLGVAVVRDLVDGERTGGAPHRYRVRRAVQSIVDQVLSEETMLLGLTTLRDHDEPTFSHCVNVCIFSVSLGQRLGLSRRELYELGMAALLHDIGKVDVPLEILNKAERLTDDEWVEMKRHTAYGAWRLVVERAPGSLPVHEVLAAFEHHLHIDGTGYPEVSERRRLSLYSRIVAIADAFDAGTTPRVYKTEPISPAEMVQVIEEGSGSRWDPILVKAFIAMLGVYPAGCVCLLDTGEIAVVVAPDPEPRNIRRPRVKIVADPDGDRVEGPVVRLADVDDEGRPLRTIVKVLDPERYDIDVQRSLVELG